MNTQKKYNLKMNWKSIVFMTMFFHFGAIFVTQTRAQTKHISTGLKQQRSPSQVQRQRDLEAQRNLRMSRQEEEINQYFMALFQNRSYTELFDLLDSAALENEKVPSLKLSCRENLPPAPTNDTAGFLNRFRRSTRLSTYQVYQSHAPCLTLEEAKFIGDYKWGDYEKINRELRSGQPSVEVAQFTQGLISVIKKLKVVPRVVFRGAGSPQHYQDLNENQLYSESFFMSTSLNPVIPKVFSLNGPSTNMVILTKSCPSFSVRNPDDEAELLCPPETQFRIHHKEVRANGNLYIVLEEV